MVFRNNLSLDTFIIAIWISALDICLIAPSLTVIAADLELPMRFVIWVIALHLAVFVLALPLMESSAAKAGKREWMFLSLFLFASGSFVAASANSWLPLIAGRVIQAVGAGGVVPVLAVEIRRITKIGKRWWRYAAYMALAAIMIVVPIISSTITWAFGWRGLFWLSMMAAVIVFLWGLRFFQGGTVRTPPYHNEGLIFFAGALLSAMMAVSQLDPTRGWPALIDPAFLPFAIVALGLLIPMMMVERQSDRPLFHPTWFLDLRLLNLFFIVALAGCTWVAIVLVPGRMAAVAEQLPGGGGIFLSVVAASAWLSIPLARWASDHWGYPGVLTFGFLATAAAYFTLALVQDVTALTLVLMVLGFGLGFTLTAPVHQLLFQIVPFKQMRNGLMVLAMFRAAGGALGLIAIGLFFYESAVFSDWVTTTEGLPELWERDYHVGMLTAAGVAVIGFVLSLLLPFSRKKEGDLDTD
ncbi:MFS transporter [Desmospora activa]|uniref:MFS transporter n=1 Tax=Desmospora activa DSM 45169 TaxID=1121389 RepID=A0A2T4ZBG5_9BACL|nr:MFS transporter [Desmospora activa]PTM59234.1 MFS transporter [Desmospora activa DSM 45169]